MKVAGLVEAIAVLMPAVDSKGLVKEFGQLTFTGSAIEATNGAMFARVGLAEEMPMFQVDAEVFYGILKTLKEEAVALTVEGELVSITGEDTSSQFGAIPGAPKHSVQYDIKPDEWKAVPAEFIKALALCRMTACKDQTAGPLTGVQVTDKGEVVATDRFRMSVYTLPGVAGCANMLLPVDLIDQLARHKASIDAYAIRDGSVYFRIAGNCPAIIGSKLLNGEFPTEKLLTIVAEVFEAEKFTLNLTAGIKKSLAEAAQRQNIIQAGTLEFDRESRIAFSKDKLSVENASVTKGRVKDKIKVPAEITCADFSFLINPTFLLETSLTATDLHYVASRSSVIFDSPSFVHVVGTKTSNVA
jgi:DNA polymerase III sliding clamp (beta) subunit (PCNA family)